MQRPRSQQTPKGLQNPEPLPEEPKDGQTIKKSYVEDASSAARYAGLLSMAAADLWEVSDFGQLFVVQT